MAMYYIKRKSLLLPVLLAYLCFIQISLAQQVTWVGQPTLQATSPGHFALTWTAADLSGVPDSINIQFRYDANPNHVASIELPGTATSYVLPVEEPINLNQFQIAVFAVTGGVPANAIVAQIEPGNPRLPPQPSGTVTQPSATTYRISNIAGATPRENYVVWAYPLGGDPATNPYIRMELPAGTTTFDVNNLVPDASQYDLSLFTMRNGIQSEAAVLVFQQDDIQLPPATVETITTDSFTIGWADGPPTFNDGRRVTHYRVTVTPADGSAVQMFDVPATAAAFHRFMGLSTGISHNVQIDAVVSNNGVQEVVDLTTMTDVVTLPNPPQNVILRQTSPTMVIITWDPPVDGNYDEYYLFYQGQNVGDNEATLSKTTNGFILDGLVENEEYRFALFSQVMPDTLSDLADITFIPLETDANVQIGALTDHGMQVTWDAVQNVQSYSVTLVGRDGSQHTVTVPGDTTEYTFTGLTSNTEYQALVDVIVNGQEGLAGSAMGITKTAGNVQSSNVQDTSMDISFNNVAGATGYLVSIISDDKSDVRVLQSTGSPQTITGLNANTNYQIGVDAIIGGVRTEIGALAEMTTDIDDSCSPNPCVNGGVCFDGVNNTFTCQCADGFTGTRCDEDIDDCSPLTCVNGGFCVDGVNTFTCQCPDGFTGTRCETTECDNMPWLAIIIAVAVLGTLLILTIGLLLTMLTKHFCKRQPSPNSQTYSHSEDKSPYHSTHIGMSNLSTNNHHGNHPVYQRSERDFEIPNTTVTEIPPTYQGLYAAIQE
ncbi:fibronectin-like [Amphiura filiformis]|uniref:fibronectin-like n=1 Tax=Amphiura filiformis TaxID=82378 RepID=UPI003B20B87B